MQARHGYDIALVESAEDAAKALASVDGSLDVVATFLPSLAVSPGIQTTPQRWYDRDEASVEGERSGLIAFIGAIHRSKAAVRQFPKGSQQVIACGGVARLATGQRARDGGPIIRGNPMYSGRPSVSGRTDSLRSGF